MVTITDKSSLTEISPCHVSRHFPSQSLPRSFQWLFVWDTVWQGWAHVQIKNITLLLYSALGKIYFKIHLGSLLWNLLSFAGPICVCLVLVTVTLDVQEPDPSWKEPWPPHSGGNPAAPLQPTLSFAPSILNQSHSSSRCDSHRLARAYVTMFPHLSLRRSSFPTWDSCISFSLLPLLTWLWEWGNPSSCFSWRSLGRASEKFGPTCQELGQPKGPWINEAKRASFPTISVSPGQKCQTPALLAHCVRVVYVPL